MILRTHAQLFVLLLISGVLSPAGHARDVDSLQGEMRDAWLLGRVETVLLLNRHLNNFSIDTQVQDGVVTLSGAVSSPVERDLAIELTRGISGVEKVENNLQVSDQPTIAERAAESLDTNSARFARWVDDVTTTASVKSKLLANATTKGLSINVDTRNDVVTLTGNVASDQERQLAGEIAANTTDVATVNNRIQVLAGNN